MHVVACSVHFRSSDEEASVCLRIPEVGHILARTLFGLGGCPDKLSNVIRCCSQADAIVSEVAPQSCRWPTLM